MENLFKLLTIGFARFSCCVTEPNIDQVAQVISVYLMVVPSIACLSTKLGSLVQFDFARKKVTHVRHQLLKRCHPNVNCVVRDAFATMGLGREELKQHGLVQLRDAAKLHAFVSVLEDEFRRPKMMYLLWDHTKKRAAGYQFVSNRCLPSIKREDTISDVRNGLLQISIGTTSSLQHMLIEGVQKVQPYHLACKQTIDTPPFTVVAQSMSYSQFVKLARETKKEGLWLKCEDCRGHIVECQLLHYNAALNTLYMNTRKSSTFYFQNGPIRNVSVLCENVWKLVQYSSFKLSLSFGHSKSFEDVVQYCSARYAMLDSRDEGFLIMVLEKYILKYVKRTQRLFKLVTIRPTDTVWRNGDGVDQDFLHIGQLATRVPHCNEQAEKPISIVLLCQSCKISGMYRNKMQCYSYSMTVKKFSKSNVIERCVKLQQKCMTY